MSDDGNDEFGDAPPAKRRGRPTSPHTLALDQTLVEVVKKYDKITVRGVFYQCVNIKAVEKTEKEVAEIGRRLVHLRRTGLIPYSMIIDESRSVLRYARYDGLADLADDVERIYRLDYWADSEVTVQVWVEKRGLAGLLRPIVCGKWGLKLHVAGGQMSETYLHDAGTEIRKGGKPAYVYALTDHDPGGKTIFGTLKHGTKGAEGGLSRFSGGVLVVVEQVALVDEQVRGWGLPTRPAKPGDTRSQRFIEEHGDRCAEFDAIPPDRLIALVEGAISKHMSPTKLAQLQAVERDERGALRRMLKARGLIEVSTIKEAQEGFRGGPASITSPVLGGRGLPEPGRSRRSMRLNEL